MEAVQLWREPLLKDLAGHRPPIEMRNHDGSGAGSGASHEEEAEYDWQDET
jgi:hypothetical protein